MYSLYFYFQIQILFRTGYIFLLLIHFPEGRPKSHLRGVLFLEIIY